MEEFNAQEWIAIAIANKMLVMLKAEGMESSILFAPHVMYQPDEDTAFVVGTRVKTPGNEAEGAVEIEINIRDIISVFITEDQFTPHLDYDLEQPPFKGCDIFDVNTR